jgi:hypothetical protein
MKNKDLDQKTNSALPLYGKLPDHSDLIKKNSNTVSMEELIGSKSERRECSVGVRITRDMKEVLEKISSKSRLSESEIVFRILEKNLAHLTQDI